MKNNLFKPDIRKIILTALLFLAMPAPYYFSGSKVHYIPFSGIDLLLNFSFKHYAKWIIAYVLISYVVACIVWAIYDNFRNKK